MTFRAYLDNIQAKTGKSPDDFRCLAEDKGVSPTTSPTGAHAAAADPFFVTVLERRTGPDPDSEMRNFPALEERMRTEPRDEAWFQRRNDTKK